MSNDDAQLRQVFAKFADKGGELDGRSFMKLCKDTKLIDKTAFSTTDVDLLFARVKGRSLRKIDFTAFEFALEEIAKKKGVAVEEVREKVCNCDGPSLTNVTQAEPVRFHDDKSTYTGVHMYGGPSTVDKRRTMIADLSDITTRARANVRGVDIKLEETLNKQRQPVTAVSNRASAERTH